MQSEKKPVSMGKVHWRCVLTMEHKCRQNGRIYSKGKQLQPNYQVYGWNFRRRTYLLGHESVQRCKIPQRIYPWRANILQTYWEFSIDEFLLVSPTRRHKEFYQGRSIQASENKFLTINFWGKYEKLRETRSLNRGYPAGVVEKHLSEVKFSDRKASLKQNNRNARRILPFVTQCHPALPNLKTLLMRKRHLIQNQPRLRRIFTEPPLISLISQKNIPWKTFWLEQSNEGINTIHQRTVGVA